MSDAVKDILDRIGRLTKNERVELDSELAQQQDYELDAALDQLSDQEIEDEWQRGTERARRIAQERGIDEAAIERIIHKTRYGS